MDDLKFDSYWEMVVFVRDHFGEETCEICNTFVDWENMEIGDRNGRMYNIENSGKIEKCEWVTMCRRCFNNIRQKEIWEEELEERALLKKDLARLDEYYDVVKHKSFISKMMED